MIPDTGSIAYMMATAVKTADEERPRSRQKAAGLLGMSEVGFCRAKALLTLRQVPESDSTPSWPAVIGTNLGERIETDLQKMFPHWLFQHRTVATLKRCMAGPVQVPGTADIIVPDWNASIDNKTKDGLEIAKRFPWSANYDFQTWLQVLGCVQDGTLDGSKPLYQGLAYWDRSGGESTPHVVLKEWDPNKEDEITAWLDDVIQARLHDPTNLDALRDIPARVCEKICEHFSVCRGSLPMEESAPITDPELVTSIELYAEAIALAKRADKMKQDARSALRGISGSTPTWTCRWITIPEDMTPGRERAGYDRLDVFRTRRRTNG